MTSRYPYKVNGVILKRRAYKEADRVLTVFTREQGKMTVVAKGVRRIPSRRAPSLELFTEVELFLHPSHAWDVVSDVRARTRFFRGKVDLMYVTMLYYMCEIVDTLIPERQQEADVYDYFVGQLARVETTVPEALGILQHEFSVAILRQLGYLGVEQKLHVDALQPFISHIAQRHIRSHRFLTKNTRNL